MFIHLLTRSWRHIFAALALAVCLMVLADRSVIPRSALADRARRSAPAAITFTVNSNSDVVDANPGDGKCETVPGNGVCTLRAAIMEANHTPGGGAAVHVPACACLYQLALLPGGMDDETNGDLNITNTMTIVGAGAADTIIDGNGSLMKDRVLSIGSGIAVTIMGITIQHGELDCVCSGGGIYSLGTLTLINSTLSGNVASTGGGLHNGSEAILINTTVSGNVASTDDGGGIVSIGDVKIINSTISGNHAALGGGVWNRNVVTLINSTLSGNLATTDGGGILNVGGHVTILNSTLSGNSANQDGGGIESGRGFDHSTLDVYNTTITDNQADADSNGSGTGGGIFNGDNGAFNFQNTILAGNAETIFFSGIWFPVTGECAGTLTSGGNNLMENYGTDHCTVNGTTPSLVDPKLGPLANNGGPTQTHALLPGSPAIDAGNSGGCRDNAGALLTTDQRGFPRPAFGGSALRCDIGAVEYYPHGVFLPLVRR